MADIKEKEYFDLKNNELFKLMAGPSQIKRKNAAKVLCERVKEKPEGFKKFIPDFIDALARPEAQTRWEVLEALTFLVPVDTKACKGAIEGAEEALFDEKTALIRESAIRFLSRYGATSVQRSKEVWPLIKEALQMYHGEVDYDRMLNRVNYFATGKLDATVKKEFRKVIKEISESVGGSTKLRLERILATLKGQKYVSPAAKANASKKSAEKKSATKKTNTKKSDDKSKKTKKAVTKKSSAKKDTEKKSTKKKSSTKKPASKKVSVKKPAAKKISSKKQVAKKPSVKKPVTKKSSSKKPVAKKSTKKSSSLKKAADKKKQVKKDIKKKATKKIIKTAISKPKAKTKIGKKIEKKNKEAAKKAVKKGVKKAVKKAIKKGKK